MAFKGVDTFSFVTTNRSALVPIFVGKNKRTFGSCSLRTKSENAVSPFTSSNSNSLKKHQPRRKDKYIGHVQTALESDAIYLPENSIWYELTMSSTNAYKHEDHDSRTEKLKQATKALLESTKGNTHLQLKLIDDIQRLGLTYHFEKEIKGALGNLDSSMVFHNLFTVGLQFRLLRQNGLPTNSEVFNKFLDKDGEFMSNLKEDVEGLLSLYEASYLGGSGDDILEKAKRFSTNHLKSLSLENLETNISQQIQWSLNSPLHERLPWAEARNFINLYQRQASRSYVLLELAKLNFNVVQSIYLEELKELAKWWTDLNLRETYPYFRDTLAECYFLALGFLPRPKLSNFRKIMAKWISIVLLLDDTYDASNTSLDELEKFTEAIISLDLKTMEALPEYWRPCYLVVYETAMETVKYASNNAGMDITPYFKKNFGNFVRGFIKEAGWFHSGYTPSFDEYLENGALSVGFPIGTVCAFFGSLDQGTITKDLLQWFQGSNSEFILLSGIIARIGDDLSLSKAEMAREEVNAISCYMIQEGVCEEEARKHLKGIVIDTWRIINDLTATKSLPTSVSEIALNFARCAAFIYAKGDWWTAELQTNNSSFIGSLIFEPILMN